MISKDRVWTWSRHDGNISSNNSTSGKWIIQSSIEQIGSLFPRIDYLVNEGRIYRAKYSHKENLDFDPLPLSSPVICVYADDSTKKGTLEELLRLGVSDPQWKYNWQTIEDWKPGGELYKRSIDERLMYMLYYSDAL